MSRDKHLAQLQILIFRNFVFTVLSLDAEMVLELIFAILTSGRVSLRFSTRVLLESFVREWQQTTLKCISVIFRTIEHLLVARNERENKAGMGTAVATVGKRRRWLRYQLPGMRNSEAIEFPETKGKAEWDARDLFHDRAWVALNPLRVRARLRRDLIIKLNRERSVYFNDYI